MTRLQTALFAASVGLYAGAVVALLLTAWALAGALFVGAVAVFAAGGWHMNHTADRHPHLDASGDVPAVLAARLAEIHAALPAHAVGPVDALATRAAAAMRCNGIDIADPTAAAAVMAAVYACDVHAADAARLIPPDAATIVPYREWVQARARTHVLDGLRQTVLDGVRDTADAGGDR